MGVLVRTVLRYDFLTRRSGNADSVGAREEHGKANGFVRYPREIVESLPERRVTKENYDKAVIKIAIALLENPNKWITEE